MKNRLLTTVPRILLGLIFLVGAIDGFSFIFTGAHLVHPPTFDRELEFEAGLKAAGFFWPLMKTVEMIGALCLLTNKAPMRGPALLSPIITVFVLFHLVLNPGAIPLALILVATSGLLAYQYRGTLGRGAGVSRRCHRRCRGRRGGVRPVFGCVGERVGAAG
jgi:putative oxidoreductase